MEGGWRGREDGGGGRKRVGGGGEGVEVGIPGFFFQSVCTCIVNG